MEYELLDVQNFNENDLNYELPNDQNFDEYDINYKLSDGQNYNEHHVNYKHSDVLEFRVNCEQSEDVINHSELLVINNSPVIENRDDLESENGSLDDESEDSYLKEICIGQSFTSFDLLEKCLKCYSIRIGFETRIECQLGATVLKQILQNKFSDQEIYDRDLYNLINKYKTCAQIKNNAMVLYEYFSKAQQENPDWYFKINFEAYCQSQECNALKHMKEQAQASSTTIAKNTTEDITENTTKDTTDMFKRQEMLAQTKLKEELIQLNWELVQLQNLEDK
ncbi:25644_t:CDS:2, partial [Gigaspora rosea]